MKYCKGSLKETDNILEAWLLKTEFCGVKYVLQNCFCFLIAFSPSESNSSSSSINWRINFLFCVTINQYFCYMATSNIFNSNHVCNDSINGRLEWYRGDSWHSPLKKQFSFHTSTFLAYKSWAIIMLEWSQKNRKGSPSLSSSICQQPNKWYQIQELILL